MGWRDPGRDSFFSADIWRRRMAERRAAERTMLDRRRDHRMSASVWCLAVALAFAFGSAVVALQWLFRR